jgi:catechol 2,3-dioxygenase-like lactoylglutathione lyase family enzyme
MPPRIDHVALPARDAEAAARFLGQILGVDAIRPDGPDGDMFNLALGEADLLFVEADHVPSHHLAFRVAEPEFRAVVARLSQAGIAFGNDPEDPTNGQTTDPLGSPGRAYFTSPDGHFLEVTVGS